MELNETYWDNRYKSNQTGWDLGDVSPPLKAYFDQLTNKDLHILIPGGGNSYEAEYLYKLGFHNTFVVDISKTALQNIKSRIPEFPSENLIHRNFFDLNLTFDLIIEQTFFCALVPSLRENYARQMKNLLKPEGKLVGLLFNVPLNSDQPPFGGNKAEYLTYFDDKFNVLTMELAYNSHTSRKGRELFFKLQKQ